MWIVYRKGDTWEVGYTVSSEQEAQMLCREDESLTYKYVG